MHKLLIGGGNYAIMPRDVLHRTLYAYHTATHYRNNNNNNNKDHPPCGQGLLSMSFRVLLGF